MRLDNIRIVVRERDSLEVLDLALRFVLALNKRAYAHATIGLVLPALAVVLTARLLFELGWPATWFLALALGALCEGFFTLVASHVLFGEPARARALAAELGSRLVAYVTSAVGSYSAAGVWATSVLLWWSNSQLISPLAGALCAIALALPCFWPWVWFSYFRETCLLERLGPRASIRRSRQLVRGAFPRAVAQQATCGFVLLSAVLLCEVLTQALSSYVLQIRVPCGDLFSDGGSLWAVTGSLAARPLTATTRFLGYIDRRTRVDGWDLQVRLMAVGNANKEQTC